MTNDEFWKAHWKTLSFWKKIQWIRWDIEFSIQNWWYRISGTCPHDSDVGKSGAKTSFCLVCEKTVPNPDYIPPKKRK